MAGRLAPPFRGLQHPQGIGAQPQSRAVPLLTAQKETRLAQTLEMDQARKLLRVYRKFETEGAMTMETLEISTAKARLQALVPTLTRIRQTTGTPSFSIGVLHQGKTIFTHSEGLCDVEKSRTVDINTTYLLGSLTKSFVAASCGILVDQGKLSWTAPLSTYVPFRQSHDPIIGERACLRDALSHSTGFPQIDLSWYGADGESILSPEDLMHVVNHLPVYPDFRAKLHYSNWMYALVGRIIEAVGGEDSSAGWGGFVRKRIFNPLHMNRSCTARSQLQDENFTEPHTVLDNGKPARLPAPDFSDQTITGASAAVWSTVPDMLSWSKSILEALEHEEGESTQSSTNPLKNIRTILAHAFPVTTDTVNENTYGFGWARHLMPSTQLGWLSINGPQEKHILGLDSRPRLLFYHGGQITGYLSSVYLFPETKSAVIVLSNAQGIGDCSDWTAQAIIQAMFQLEPALDFPKVVAETAKEHLSMYDDMMKEYEAHRTKDTHCPPIAEFTGTFINDDIRMRIEIYEIRDGLEMRLNGRDSQRHQLQHYHYDIFGFPPKSREEKELRCLVDYFVYDQFILSFQRDDDGETVSLEWKMQESFPPLKFISNVRG